MRPLFSVQRELHKNMVITLESLMPHESVSVGAEDYKYEN